MRSPVDSRERPERKLWRCFAFKVDPDDALAFEEYLREHRMGISSAVRLALVEANMLPRKREVTTC